MLDNDEDDNDQQLQKVLKQMYNIQIIFNYDKLMNL